MTIGDLVKYRDTGWRSWLGIIIQEVPGSAEYKTVQWLNTDDGSHARVTHKARELFKLNENR